MKIIAFAGMPFSGKSEAVRIAKDYKIPVIRMGDMIWEETKKQGAGLTWCSIHQMFVKFYGFVQKVLVRI